MGRRNSSAVPSLFSFLFSFCVKESNRLVEYKNERSAPDTLLLEPVGQRQPDCCVGTSVISPMAFAGNRPDGCKVFSAGLIALVGRRSFILSL